MSCKKTSMMQCLKFIIPIKGKKSNNNALFYLLTVIFLYLIKTETASAIRQMPIMTENKNYLIILPSPPIKAVISSMRSSGNGGAHNGFNAIDISFIGLSSAALRFELSFPQRLHL